MRASTELGQKENVSRDEGNRRMMQIGKLLAITGFAGPVLFLFTWKLEPHMSDLFVLTLPLCGISLVAGIALWIAGFIKDGYSQ